MKLLLKVMHDRDFVASDSQLLSSNTMLINS